MANHEKEGFFELGLPTFICIPPREVLQSFYKGLSPILNLQQQLQPIAPPYKP